MKNIFKKLTAVYIAVFIFIATVQTAYASAFEESKLATGTTKLIDDVTKWLLILAPTVGALVIVYFLIRRSHADEMDEKKWSNRIKVAVASVIGAVVASSIINVIVGYYK